MNPKKFGAFVAERRRALGLTQEELAGRIAVTNKAISRWETGLGFPDIGTIEPLADALGVTIVELMKSEKIPAEALTPEAADEAIAGAVGIAEAGRKRWTAKTALIFTFLLFFIAAAFYLGLQIYYSMHPEIDLIFTAPYVMTENRDENPPGNIPEPASQGIIPLGSAAYQSGPVMRCKSVFGPAKAPALAFSALKSWSQGILKEGAALAAEGPYLILPYAEVRGGKTRLYTVGYFTENGKIQPIYNTLTLDYELHEIKNPPKELFERVQAHAPDAMEEFNKAIGEMREGL